MAKDRESLIKSFKKAANRVQSKPKDLARVLLLPVVASTGNSSNSTAASSSARNYGRQEQFLASDGTDWSEVLSSWLDAWKAAEEGRAVQCFEAQSTLHAAFNQIFSSYNGNFLVPAIHAVCRSSKRAATAADKALDSRDFAKTNSCVQLLQDSFSKAFNDRKELVKDAPYHEEGSKKAGTLGIVNELFSIYFVLNTLRLCNNLIKPVEAKQLHTKGTMAEMVTYRYYAGRLCLFEDNFEMAETHLDYAFINCHKNAIQNKRCILRYLIPVKMFRGRLPAAHVIQKYELYEFAELSNSLRTGDMKKFNDAMNSNEHSFIRQGTYLLLERCKTICYRNLLKRIHLVVGTHLLPLDKVIYTFQWLDMRVDLDEAECIIANLIYKRIVRGYIHHSKRLVVLSKQNPFPIEALSNQSR